MRSSIKNSRELALHILNRIETDQAYITVILDAEFANAKCFDSRDRALTTELVYGVERWKKRLDWYLDQVCKKPVRQTTPWMRHILRLGAYQLLMLDRIPPSAAINESVKLAGKYSRNAQLPARTAKGFVNAVLRQLARNDEQLKLPETLNDPASRLAVQYSFPEWLVQRWIQRLGTDGAEHACHINNQPAPLSLRVNTLKTSLERLQHDLAGKIGQIRPLPGNLPGINISGAPSIAELACYQRGECTVQNAASMLISLILGPQPGENVLETCAGSGTKTTHIAELMNNRGEITAADLYDKKLQRLQENCTRWGVAIVHTFCGDMTTATELPGYDSRTKQGFDRILVDAPCSGLGVLRKHPEAKWTRNELQIRELQALQIRLLTHAATFLHPERGVLVYSTCTTEPEENEQIISQFFTDVQGFHIESPQQYLPREIHQYITPEGFLRIDPPQQEFDGFFCARLVRGSPF